MCLTDLRVNAAAVNAALGSGSPVRLLEGAVATVKVTVSYAEILTKSCVIELAGLALHVQPVDQSGAPPTPPPAAVAAAPPPPVPPAPVDTDDDAASEGLDMLAGWVETIVSRIRVCATDVVMSASVPGAAAARGGGGTSGARRIAVHIPALEFSDHTLSTGAPLVGTGAPLLQKLVTISGIRLCVHAGDGPAVTVAECCGPSQVRVDVANEAGHATPDFAVDALFPELRIRLGEREVTLATSVAGDLAMAPAPAAMPAPPAAAAAAATLAGSARRRIEDLVCARGACERAWWYVCMCT